MHQSSPQPSFVHTITANPVAIVGL